MQSSVNSQERFWLYSMRSASIGSMLAARRAGMKPANPAASANTATAIAILTGS